MQTGGSVEHPYLVIRWSLEYPALNRASGAHLHSRLYSLHSDIKQMQSRLNAAAYYRNLRGFLNEPRTGRAPALE
jgi:hypothetical protein